MNSLAQTTQVAEQSMFQKIRNMGFAEIYRRYGTILIFIGIFIFFCHIDQSLDIFIFCFQIIIFFHDTFQAFDFFHNILGFLNIIPESWFFHIQF